MMAAKSNSDPEVLYSPPAPETLDAFAWQVCRQLGESYAEPEVVRGLAAFIQVAAQIQAKQLNKVRRAVDNAD